MSSEFIEVKFKIKRKLTKDFAEFVKKNGFAKSMSILLKIFENINKLEKILSTSYSIVKAKTNDLTSEFDKKIEINGILVSKELISEVKGFSCEICVKSVGDVTSCPIKELYSLSQNKIYQCNKVKQ